MLNDAALVVGSTAIEAAITHFQLHSSGTNPGANAVGARQPVNAVVDADGDITWAGPVTFTGLPANTPVTFVSYWSALTVGTNYGGFVPTGDTSANSEGVYTVEDVVEAASAT